MSPATFGVRRAFSICQEILPQSLPGQHTRNPENNNSFLKRNHACLPLRNLL
jgi:hypothetical protein